MDLKEAAEFRGNRHPWELERARIVPILARTTFEQLRPSILDVGAGDGFLVKDLSRRYPEARIVAIDPGYATSTVGGLFNGTGIRALPSLEALGRERFDLILLLDVLEHVDDDLGLLRTCAERLLEPAGRILVFAPAFPALYSDHDRFLEHKRRYRLPALRRLAAASGLRCDRTGYLFVTPLLLRSFSVLTGRIHRSPAPSGNRGVSTWARGSLATRLVAAVLGCENSIAVFLARAGIRIPGLTVWMLCSRP